VGTLVLQRSHKYFELEIFQFYLWSWMLCKSNNWHVTANNH